jgi:hypothetical protein
VFVPHKPVVHWKEINRPSRQYGEASRRLCNCYVLYSDATLNAGAQCAILVYLHPKSLRPLAVVWSFLLMTKAIVFLGAAVLLLVSAHAAPC